MATALIGLGGSLIGGLISSHAAKKAAEKQKIATDQARKELQDQTNLSNENITRQAGEAGSHAAEVAAQQGEHVLTTADRANERLNPYSALGSTTADTLSAGLTPGGDFNKTPGLSDLTIDPGYAFRLKEGQQALERSAAARGGALGGGAIKDILGYSQGLASQEYQNAFNRYQTSTQNRYSNLFGATQLGAGTATTQGANQIAAGNTNANLNVNAAQYAGDKGYNAAVTTGDNSINTARTGADLLTGGANASAAGTVGSANALGGAISGGANAVSNAILLKDILKNPALKTVGDIPGGALSPSQLGVRIGR